MLYLKKIRQILDKNDEIYLYWLVFLSFLVSLVETLGISAIMPFVDVATDFSKIHSNNYYKTIYSFFNFDAELEFVIWFGYSLFSFYLIRGGIIILHSYLIASFSQKLYAKFTNKIYSRYLGLPYNTFVSLNSSYLTKVIISEASYLAGIVKAALTMFSEIFILVLLYVLMMITSWEITITFTLLMIFTWLVVVRKISKRIERAGSTREKFQADMYEATNRLFGNFKQIKLHDNDRLSNLRESFSAASYSYVKANTLRIFLDALPRYLVETIGFSLIILAMIFALYINQSNITNFIPVISVFILALYRLLPSINRIIGGYHVYRYYKKSITIVSDTLALSTEKFSGETLNFKSKITLKNISFSHGSKSILENVSFSIQKGEKIGFFGQSGAGKSTLVDIFAGLSKPSEGNLLIDDVLVTESNLLSWRSKIGYISQHLYLFDGTITENICFGRELVPTRLISVLKSVDLYEFFTSNEGFDTLVGENGLQLSGGQKQRVAIARALYSNPDILILDEATSALDPVTEEVVMNQIFTEYQDITVLVVTHKVENVKYCDKVYSVENQKVSRLYL
jgi:ABC-type multidrug transport system fused ATPase/permease subunit